MAPANRVRLASLELCVGLDAVVLVLLTEEAVDEGAELFKRMALR
jgi:hypothetical protein